MAYILIDAIGKGGERREQNCVGDWTYVGDADGDDAGCGRVAYAPDTVRACGAEHRRATSVYGSGTAQVYGLSPGCAAFWRTGFRGAAAAAVRPDDIPTICRAGRTRYNRPVTQLRCS